MNRKKERKSLETPPSRGNYSKYLATSPSRSFCYHNLILGFYFPSNSLLLLNCIMVMTTWRLFLFFIYKISILLFFKLSVPFFHTALSFHMIFIYSFVFLNIFIILILKCHSHNFTVFRSWDTNSLVMVVYFCAL